MNSKLSKCPICEVSCTIQQIPDSSFGEHINVVGCPRCGSYTVIDLTKERIEKALTLDESGLRYYSQMTPPSNRAGEHDIFIEVARKCGPGGMVAVRSLLSHEIRKRKSISRITSVDIANILKHRSLPTPGEQANNLIMFLGERLVSPGSPYKFPEKNAPQGQENIYGLLGLRTQSEWADLCFLTRSLEEQTIVKVRNAGGGTLTLGGEPIVESVALTLLGWQKFEELKRSITDSRKAFVAMAFVNPEKPDEDYFFQNELLNQYLVPAVKQTGYELSNPLASNPMAGNIHARMEVEIRTARFVVAELSHHNNGAYWEAGFARALGMPVIYMYNKSIGKSEKPHFDVGSDHIIFWEKNKLDEAAEALKGTIRSTLFGEAKMSDD
jgi:hypothetical protein